MQASCDVFHKRPRNRDSLPSVAMGWGKIGVMVELDWETRVRRNFAPGTAVHGRVSSISAAGVTVQLAPDVEGLLQPGEAGASPLRLGQWLDVVVISIDPEGHFVALARKR